MGLRSSVGAACALALVVCGSDAWAGPCTGGNCPAANLVVTGIVSPQSAGTTSSAPVPPRPPPPAPPTAYTRTPHPPSPAPHAPPPPHPPSTSSTAATTHP